jgi:hypothetical protein
MAIAKKHFFKNPRYCLAFRALDGIFESEKLLRHGLISIPPRRV